MFSDYSMEPGQAEAVHMPSARRDVQQENAKESKMSQILHWLTNPDSRDVRLAQKMGIPVEMGVL